MKHVAAVVGVVVMGVLLVRGNHLESTLVPCTNLKVCSKAAHSFVTVIRASATLLPAC